MKKATNNELNARIQRFIDRKVSTMIDMTDLSDRKVRRNHRQFSEVSNSPFIALAIK